MKNQFKTSNLILIACLSFNLISLQSLGQIKIVVLGSSSAAGVGASSYSNSWVGKYTGYLQGLNSSYSLVNLAVSGFSTYSVMPTGSNVGEDPTHNITAALSFSPNIIIVNLPSNDVIWGLSVAETMANFRRLRELSNNAGVAFWITTTQPRNFGPYGQDLLKSTRDSIIAQFGNYVIDFWTTVANTDGSINPMYNSGDGVHINDAGHEIFFQRTKSQPILGNGGILPLHFTSFTTQISGSENLLTWSIGSGSDSFSQEVQQSVDGLSFFTIKRLPYSTNNVFFYRDKRKTAKTYYRIKATLPSSVKYSEVVTVIGRDKLVALTVFPNPIYQKKFQLQFVGSDSGLGHLLIRNLYGQELFRSTIEMLTGTMSQMCALPHSFPTGNFILSLYYRGKAFSQFITVN